MSTENDIKVLRVDSQAGVNETLDAMLRAIGAPYGFSYAKALGVPANTIKTWRRRDKVPLSALRRFADDNGLQIEYLDNQKIPAAAEDGEAASDVAVTLIRERDVERLAGPQGLDFVAASDGFLRAIGALGGQLGMATMRGSSMAPTIEHGDQVLVNYDLSAGLGDDVYLIRHAASEKIKRIQRLSDGGLRVSSDNPAFEPEHLAPGQCAAISVLARVLPYKFGRFRL